MAHHLWVLWPFSTSATTTGIRELLTKNTIDGTSIIFRLDLSIFMTSSRPSSIYRNDSRDWRYSTLIWFSLVENGGGGTGAGADEMVEESRKRVALYSTPVWIPPKGNSQQQQYGPAGGQRQVEREMSSSTKSSSSFSSSSHPSTLMTSFQPQQGDEEWANIHTVSFSFFS